jgi:hypothetical protein
MFLGFCFYAGIMRSTSQEMTAIGKVATGAQLHLPLFE